MDTIFVVDCTSVDSLAGAFVSTLLEAVMAVPEHALSNKVKHSNKVAIIEGFVFLFIDKSPFVLY
ncbi:hypothetical protein D3C79_974180 [compost metagenome]